jgi:predicted DNA-binding transcriptional regulator AlpA
MPTTDGGLLDAKRVAELLGISTRTLRNWVRRGFFPQPVRLGPTGRLLRWPPTELVRYLKARAEAGGRPAPSGPVVPGQDAHAPGGTPTPDRASESGAGSVAVRNTENETRSPR